MTDKKIKFCPAAIFFIVSIALNIIFTLPFYGYMWGIRFSFTFPMAVDMLVTIFLCVMLFMKRRDTLLLAALAGVNLMAFVNFLNGFGVETILRLLAFGFVLILALSLIEQKIVNVDVSKIAHIFKKFYYLPAAAVGLGTIIGMIADIVRHLPFLIVFKFLVCGILVALGLLFLAGWLIDPYEKEKPVSAAPVSSGTSAPAAGTACGNANISYSSYCSLGKHIVLSIVTCGVWYYMWIFRTTKFLNQAPGAQEYSPTKKMLLCMFIPFYQIYWCCKHARRLTDLSKAVNPAFGDQTVMYILFGIFVPIVSCILMQVRVNQLCQGVSNSAPVQVAAPAEAAAPVSAKPSENSNVEALRSYKELLDSGVITQEEFDAKKKQLLGL